MEPKPKEFRRYLRKESTTAEKILWFHFRNRKFLGLKIRRQHTIENFVVDFYIDELKLIIEVDGSVHDNQGQLNYDHFRNRVLESKGYSVVRIDNVSVIDYTEAALE
ncbi:endonuclease domain-containing protein [Pedobacter sp. P351]|uniref:endonuclease domain-containing protein n=1 Tax=Pedobacter superstes TaxID=3133441 RepID=UPI0030B4C683